MSQLVYFSSSSGNTERFVGKLGLPSIKLPESAISQRVIVDQPYVLVCPTYSDGQGRGAVPKSVIHFLNQTSNRGYIRGVIASGNRNFGELFARSGDIIAHKCQIPLLYRFELAGTDTDVNRVQNGLSKFWSMIC